MVRHIILCNILYKINSFSIAEAKIILFLVKIINKKNIYIQTLLTQKIWPLIEEIWLILMKLQKF